MDQLPVDFFVTTHAYTPHVFRDEYPAINPSSAALSQSGKVIIITGASAGIGANGFAPAFAKAQPKGIVLVGRNVEKLQATKTAIEKLAPKTKIVALAADLTDVASVEKLFASIKSTFGHADVLINNAGLFSPAGTIGTVDPSEWWKDFDVNVKGTFLVTQAFLKLLGTEKQGSIITMSTGISYMSPPGLSAYSISKMAGVRLSEYISMENPNVAAISLQPGIVKTDMVKGKH
jgi:NAD(P)-dependent dehydrogenase (short-subunit alcohol dehydrogenase family)